MIDLLCEGDRLVFNDTRVIPARLYGIKPTGGRIEFLFTEQIDDMTWKALVNPGRRLKQGASVQVENERDLFLRIKEVLPDGDRVVSVDPGSISTLKEILKKHGHIPLPHYINRDDEMTDRESYQTVFAREDGAIAAPTAGLHFTEGLMAQIRTAGIDVSFITLHVGIGTFRPVKVSDPLMHDMHEERFKLTEQTAGEIIETRAKGKRVIAVGTTVVRVLEHCSASGILTPSSGRTRLMILPSYKFKTTDGMITNFHLPKSTLLMLVCAFAGTNQVLNAYREAVMDQYRFYSYGDAMLIV